jgi:MYXO-CTERM domain-containing protein
LGVFANGPSTSGSHGLIGMAFGAGNLYVADFYAQQILQYNGTLGGNPSTFASGAGQADSVAYGADGHVYWTNFGGAVIKSGSGSFSSAPGGGARELQFRPDGFLYFAGQFGSAIYRVDGTTGGTATVFASGGGMTNPLDFEFVQSAEPSTAAAGLTGLLALLLYRRSRRMRSFNLTGPTSRRRLQRQS